MTCYELIKQTDGKREGEELPVREKRVGARGENEREKRKKEWEVWLARQIVEEEERERKKREVVTSPFLFQDKFSI
jgi:hypothetical protein